MAPVPMKLHLAAAWYDVRCPRSNQVTAAQLAIDAEIEKRQAH
jgi:hypothetical protein